MSARIKASFGSDCEVSRVDAVVLHYALEIHLKEHLCGGEDSHNFALRIENYLA